MNKTELVYFRQNSFGKIENEKITAFDKAQTDEVFLNIENRIKDKDSKRQWISRICGLAMLFIAIVFGILLIFNVLPLGSSKWFTYTYIVAGLILIWVLLYYILGFIFYSKENITIHFKNLKSNNPNACSTYASTSYASFVESYCKYLKNTNFIIETKNPKKPILVPFGLIMPSRRKNFIFNGKVYSNIPYFYLSISNTRFLFFPGFVIYVNKENSKIIPNSDFKCVFSNNLYNLYACDEKLVSFKCNGTFNLNFFNFKY